MEDSELSVFLARIKTSEEEGYLLFCPQKDIFCFVCFYSWNNVCPRADIQYMHVEKYP